MPKPRTPWGKPLGVDTKFWENLSELSKATKAHFFWHQREGQTVHYGLRKVLCCSASKAILLLIALPPSRIHLTWFRRLNEFSSTGFGYCTDSYVLIQYVSKI
jgi:hypothetical protein